MITIHMALRSMIHGQHTVAYSQCQPAPTRISVFNSDYLRGGIFWGIFFFFLVPWSPSPLMPWSSRPLWPGALVSFGPLCPLVLWSPAWGQGVACARAFWGRKYTRMVLGQGRKYTRMVLARVARVIASSVHAAKGLVCTRGMVLLYVHLCSCSCVFCVLHVCRLSGTGL